MTDQAHQSFDPGRALKASRAGERVQSTIHQELLDITTKKRSSVLPWKGQFSPQLVEFLLARNVAPGDTVLDPFCGSGTVLYEAARARAGAVGLDINPAAIRLAKIAQICAVDRKARSLIIEEMHALHVRLVQRALYTGDSLTAIEAVSLLPGDESTETGEIASIAYLMIAFGDATIANRKRLDRALTTMAQVIRDIPVSLVPLRVSVGDARSVNAESSSVDYVLTSPPYINVFNYHQNYRPIAEALGYEPLTAARSEIGANRKFRQNRFMTVVQYCMDVSLMFVEMSRLLKPRGRMTMVLGRESNVRSVAFRNGELVCAISVEGMGCDLVEWNERKFVNRYGATIYEEVVTLIPRRSDEGAAVEIGRAVGRQALTNALERCPADLQDEIAAAIDCADRIGVSP